MPYAIAAGHEVTAEAATTILDAGGNAFDAAIAAFMTSWVAEPCMSGAAGGGFANIRTASGQSHLFDFFVQTPLQKRPLEQIEFLPIDVNFGDVTEVFYAGRGATGVPGSVAGVFELHRRFATMPMKVLVQPAIKYAKEGVAINNFQYKDFILLSEILKLDPRGQELFFDQDKIKPIGSIIKMKGMADMLDLLAREGERAFYEGDIASLIVKDHTSGGGYLTRSDFENYSLIEREPLTFSYKNKSIITNTFPSTGGPIIALILKILEKEPPATLHTPAYIHQLYTNLLEVAKYGNRPADLQQGLQEVLNINHHANLEGNLSHRGATTHFGIVDKDKNAIGLTVSLGQGAGHFVEGTDMHMNNMLGEAALLPDGFHTWKNNVRLASMMSPTLVLDEKGEIEIVAGSGGAGRIPSAISQVLRYIIDYKLPLHSAVNTARVHLEPKRYNVEYGFDCKAEGDLGDCELVNWKQQSLFFGGVHSITCKNGVLDAAGDERRDGVVVVK